MFALTSSWALLWNSTDCTTACDRLTLLASVRLLTDSESKGSFEAKPLSLVIRAPEQHGGQRSVRPIRFGRKKPPESMQKVCRKYAESMQKVCRKYAESMQKVYKSMFSTDV